MPPQITVVPAARGTWPLVEHALTGGGDGASCWCQWFLLGPGQKLSDSTRAQLRDRLRAEVEAAPTQLDDQDEPVSPSSSAPADHPATPTTAPLPPGLVALVDGTAAGWCRVGPRVAQPRLGRSRVMRSGGTRPLDDADVWAVSCFVVRREFRHHGVAHELARAAVEFARDRGARVVEGYPIDVEARPNATASELFHGSASVFREAGFREVARPTPGRVVMSIDLGDEGDSPAS